VSGEQDMCSGQDDMCSGQDDMCSSSGRCVRGAGQDNSNHWLAPTHDPVVMGGPLRRGDLSDTPSSLHLDNVDASYANRWDDFFSLPSTLQLGLFPWSYSSCPHI